MIPSKIKLKALKAELGHPKTSTPTQMRTKPAYKKLIRLEYNQNLLFPYHNHKSSKCNLITH